MHHLVGLFPYTSCYHVPEFLPSCFSPLLSFYLVGMPPCFFEVSGFVIPDCTYESTHHSTLHVEILKIFFGNCKHISCLSSCSSGHKLLPYINATHLPFQMLTYVHGSRIVAFNFIMYILDIISNFYVILRFCNNDINITYLVSVSVVGFVIVIIDFC